MAERNARQQDHSSEQNRLDPWVVEPSNLEGSQECDGHGGQRAMHGAKQSQKRCPSAEAGRSRGGLHFDDYCTKIAIDGVSFGLSLGLKPRTHRAFPWVAGPEAGLAAAATGAEGSCRLLGKGRRPDRLGASSLSGLADLLPTRTFSTQFMAGVPILPGMLKSKANSDGTTTTIVSYEYDDLYNLKKKDFPSGTDPEFETDANGRTTKMKDASGEKRYTYDDADRLTKVEQGPVGFTVGTDQNYVLEYAWNAASQRTQAKLTVRTQSAKQWDSTFHDDGELNLLTNPDGDETKHEYLTDGRLKKITLLFQTASNKSTREYFHQDTNDSHAYVSGENRRLRKTLDKKQAGTTICSFEYELDAAGNRLSMKDKDGKYWAYAYDPTRQLVAETEWSAKTPGSREYQNAYLYDPNGNRLAAFGDGVKTAYTYGDNDEMTAAGSDAFTYDQFGNAKTKVSGGSTTTYNWDHESHLTGIDYPNTSNDDSHEYDANGLRMRSKLDGAAEWTHFVHDDLTGELLAEYTLISGTFTIKSVNTYGIGLISTNREGTRRYFHFDGLGSTWALTDASENVTDEYSYKAFGVLDAESSTNGPSLNPFRYVGQWGYYDDGARGSVAGLFLTNRSYYVGPLGRHLTLANRSLRNLSNATPMPSIDPIYGYHCGPQSKAGPPYSVDALDECCRLHDQCFERFGCNVFNQFFKDDCRECNAELCVCAKGVDCSLNPWRKDLCPTIRSTVIGYACAVSQEVTHGSYR